MLCPKGRVGSSPTAGTMGVTGRPPGRAATPIWFGVGHLDPQGPAGQRLRASRMRRAEKARWDSSPTAGARVRLDPNQPSSRMGP